MFGFGLVMGAVIVLLLEFCGAILYHVMGGIAREKERQAAQEEQEAARQAQAQAWGQAEVRREAVKQLAIKREMARMEDAHVGV